MKWFFFLWKIRICVCQIVISVILITPVVFIHFTFWIFGCSFAVRWWFQLRLISLWCTTTTAAATTRINAQHISIKIIPWFALFHVQLMYQTTTKNHQALNWWKMKNIERMKIIHSVLNTYGFFFWTKTMSYIKWTRFQFDFRMLFSTFYQMCLDATFHNDMTLIVRTHNRFIIAWQFCAHDCAMQW